MKSCIYPGSFDPITLGHLDVIERASSLFEKVYVAIGNNLSKSYTFTVEQRIKLIKYCVKHLTNVEVVSFNGLLADYAYEMGCKVVIKGVRNFQDFDYERLLHEVGLTQQKGIETFIIFSRTELSHVSSTSAKELCKSYGLIDEYVPLVVKEAMELQLNHQFIVGVTGEIGMGKSYVSAKLAEARVYPANQIYGKNIDLDKIGHDILHDRNEQIYLDLRQLIIKEFNLTKSNVIDRKQLGDIVFNDKGALDKLNKIMRIPMLTRIRRECGNHSGVIILNGSLLVEADFLTLCNNNIIVVKSPKDKQYENLKARGYTPDQIERRLEAQFTTQRKIDLIKESIKKYKYGKLIEFENYSYDFHYGTTASWIFYKHRNAVTSDLTVDK